MNAEILGAPLHWVHLLIVRNAGDVAITLANSPQAAQSRIPPRPFNFSQEKGVVFLENFLNL